MSNSTLAAPAGSAGDQSGTPAGNTPAGGRSGPRRTGRGRSKPMHLRNRPLWMLLPGGILMILVIVVPLIVAVLMSTLDLDQYTLQSWLQAPFIGLQNYVEAVVSSTLLRSIGISVSFAVIAAVVTMPIGVAAALATQNKFRGRALVRSLFLIPYVLPAFVVGTLWRTMLQPGGVVDSALGSVGAHPGLFLNGPLSYWSLIIVQIWTSWPFFYLLVLAGLQSVDHEVHEAAAIDGATWWIKLRYVILPYLRGPIFLALIIAFLHNINAFTLPFVLFGVPAPQDVDVLPVLTYVTSFQSFRFGLSAAMAICSLILIAIPLFVYLRAVKLDSGDEGEKR
ncbi:carbohydrate ABC transporter permease [Leifsonia sp. NPDC058292]|uniref:carbohydrate ABC transporter permease n=1 Tax=Leifsonia sp. NPDC058292 TaxID=3346428 RepID=UPI0036D7FF81